MAGAKYVKINHMNFERNNSGLEEEVIEKHIKALAGYREELLGISKESGYCRPEAFINLPSDQKIFDDVEGVISQKKCEELKYVFLVGIGGSKLGTKAIYDALYGYFDDISGSIPQLIFLDTINSAFLEKVKNLIENEISSLEEVALVVVSKSGRTTETLANAEFLLSFLKDKPGSIEDRTVVITENRSPLDKFAKEREFSTLYIPSEISGRYSVFTPVGLLPLGLVGLDIQRVREGAIAGRDMCLRGGENNPALVSAVATFENIKRGRDIINNFFFHPELESLGKWWRQLFAESLGKEKNKEGEEIEYSATPITSIGSMDLHSMFQLFMGGAQDKFTFFAWSKSRKNSIELSDPVMEGKLAGKGADEISKALLEGVKESYKQEGEPFLETILSEISEYSIGEFMSFKMMETIYLAELLNVNAFNQPKVEMYKNKVEEILGNY